MTYATGRAANGMAAAKNGVKRCSMCKQPLPISDFGRNRRQSDGFQNVCNPCRRNYWNGWYTRRKEKDPGYLSHQNAVLKGQVLSRTLKRYGLVREQYDALVLRGCAICSGSPNGRGRFHFDHDHVSGKFRGLLCHLCNVALGGFKDDQALLARAIQYLAEHGE